MCGCGLIGQADAVHRAIQPVAAAITGEDAPGPIGTVGRRRESENQNACRRIAEAGDAATPVVLVAIRGSFLTGRLLTPRDQPWTTSTRTHVIVKCGQNLRRTRRCGHATTRLAPAMASRKSARTAPPASTLVLFVRHGQTPTTGKLLPGRAAGLHLADTGVEQARTAAERIAAIKKVDAVYASPLERAKETAAPISKALGLRTSIDRGLLECDFGDWTGAELKKLMKLPEWGTVQKSPSSFRFPNGESFTEMQTRIVSAVHALCAKHPGGTIVCVSHADPIKAAVAHAMGTHLDLFQRIVISTCSVSAVAYTGAGPIVLTVNSTGGSLAELRPS